MHKTYLNSVDNKNVIYPKLAKEKNVTNGIMIQPGGLNRINTKIPT